jgi:L-alanine-DL-glutamate epimerase-like enolase superfamily enzyme
MGMHSFWEMGLATALNLHLAAAHRQVDHAIDGIQWLYEDDIIAGPRMVVQDGALPVTEGPGVGVDLDEDKVARFRIEEKILGAANKLEALALPAAWASATIDPRSSFDDTKSP